MIHSRWKRRVSLAGAALIVAGAPNGSAQSPEATDAQAAHAAHEAMTRPSAADAHLRLSPTRPATAADSARAAQLVVTMRTALARYGDVRAAEADGYRRFLPGVKQPVYHYTNWMHGLQAAVDFDPARPTSLLYREETNGRLALVGAMYTAPARLSDDALDARIPLGVARWHLHVNWCLPPRGEERRWREEREGAPVFGPKSPVATAEACRAVGGRFLPRIFGWMVHVNAFGSDDPAVIWGRESHRH
jgi:hypothetical protein